MRKFRGKERLATIEKFRNCDPSDDDLQSFQTKYFEFKNFRFSMTSRHPLSVRKAEILEFLRIRESLNVLYRFKINVEFRTCFTGSIPYIGNIQMAPLKLKKL